ncbi:MAG: LLM class flavin-dependent oxidoreductase [Acidimicrobiales bacterium]
MTAYGLISLADHLVDPVLGVKSSQSQRIHELVEQAVLAEQAGFHSFGLGEHHFSNYIMPAPELALANMAARTSKILLGTSVSLLANLDPVRFAEQLALLDILTNGRAEVTFARGASEETIHAFGIESFDDLRPKFAESLRLVLRLLTEESVTWSRHYRTRFEDLTIQPRHTTATPSRNLGRRRIIRDL